MSYTDPHKRHDFVYIFDVTNGNPNGDPDAGNLPRIDPETMHGLITDVCLKRKVRDYVHIIHEKPIFIQSQVALNSLIAQSYIEIGIEPAQIEVDDEELLEWFKSNQVDGFMLEGHTLSYSGESTKDTDISKVLLNQVDESSLNTLESKIKKTAKELSKASKGKKRITPEKRVEAREKMIQDYYDIRMFGAVLSTGLNAGQVRGPMQMTFARSVDPILPLDLTITRQARTTAERMETGGTEIGRKPVVPYGLYVSHGFYSPYLAAKNVAESDLEIYWDALVNMFEHDRSAARGQMSCRGLYVFTHVNPKGNAPAHKLFQRIEVKRKESVQAPRNFDNYKITINEQQMPSGVKLNKLYHE